MRAKRFYPNLLVRDQHAQNNPSLPLGASRLERVSQESARDNEGESRKTGSSRTRDLSQRMWGRCVGARFIFD